MKYIRHAFLRLQVCVCPNRNVKTKILTGAKLVSKLKRYSFGSVQADQFVPNKNFNPILNFKIAKTL